MSGVTLKSIILVTLATKTKKPNILSGRLRDQLAVFDNGIEIVTRNLTGTTLTCLSQVHEWGTFTALTIREASYKLGQIQYKITTSYFNGRIKVFG